MSQRGFVCEERKVRALASSSCKTERAFEPIELKDQIFANKRHPTRHSNKIFIPISSRQQTPLVLCKINKIDPKSQQKK
jgi:hypothetical protein